MSDECWICGTPRCRMWKKSTNLCWICHNEIAQKVWRNVKRARIKGNETGLTVAEWSKVLRASEGCCHYCHKYFGFRSLVIEHTIPIAHGGGTVAKNCVPACGYCNDERWKIACKSGGKVAR